MGHLVKIRNLQEKDGWLACARAIALCAVLGAVFAAVLGVGCSSSSGGGRSCFSDAECAGKLCVSGTCQDGVRPPQDGGAGSDGGARPDGGGEAVDGGASDGGSGCTTDSECGAPANICSGSRCVAGCGATGCGSGRACGVSTGRCGACNNDRDCGSPASVCDTGQCVPGCGVAGCALRNATCNATTGRCSACSGDVACNPPSTVCVEGGCVAGCATSGCSGGQTCGSAGRCQTQGTVGNGQLGADCQQDLDCQGGKCLELSVSGRAYRVCSKLCCAETDCPTQDSAGNGVGCIEFYGANFCLTDRIFAGTGVKLQRAVGQACGPSANDNWCRSGLCRTDSGTRSCQATCCSNADCGAFTCAFRPGFSPGEMAHHACERNLTGGTNNTPCSSELDCAAFMCIPLGQQPFCADTCCTARDCPSGWACTQLESGQTRYTNVGMACIPNSGGAPAGAACTVGVYPNECQSGVCAAGTCRNPCCYDADCATTEACRSVDNGQTLDGLTRTGLVRVCLTR